MIQELVCLGDGRCVEAMLPDKGTVLFCEIALATAIRWWMRANVSIPHMRIRNRSRIDWWFEGKVGPVLTTKLGSRAFRGEIIMRRHDFAS